MHIFVDSMHTIFHFIYTILYIQRTYFLKECTHFSYSLYINFQFCAFNVYNFAKNVDNSLHLMYTIFQMSKT